MGAQKLGAKSILSPPYILAVDTSQPIMHLAVGRGSEILASVVDESESPHSQRIFPLIEKTLASLFLPLSSIDLFAVNTGPGSFTGLRVGIAAMQSIAVTLGKPFLGLNKMDAFAYSLGRPGITVVILLSAGRGEYYWGTRLLQENISLLKIGTDRLATTAQVLTEMKGVLGTTKTVFVGDGAAALWPEFIVTPNWQLVENSIPLVNSISRWVGGQTNFKVNVFPYYLRQSDAEVKRIR